jgi:hypothetical protein
MAPNVPTEELTAARQRVSGAAAWDEVFKGIARLRLTADGSGIGVALTIQKQGGIPVRLVRDGEDPAATVAVRKVNSTDFSCFGAKELGKRLKLDLHKTLALIWKLGLQRDADCFSEISIGRSKHKMYSQNALARLREEIPNLDRGCPAVPCGLPLPEPFCPVIALPTLTRYARHAPPATTASGRSASGGSARAASSHTSPLPR